MGREAFVASVLGTLHRSGTIADYTQSSKIGRYDFTVAIERDPDYFAALEVKGGEGNSVNISERPLWAKEFGVWCFLDGAIVNQPANGARAIIGRLTGELVKRGKLVDVLFFRDTLCGTRARPCPKYPGKEEEMEPRTAPDVFLFPESVPSATNPEPKVHSIDSLKLPMRVLQAYQVESSDIHRHTWEVQVRFHQTVTGQSQYATKVIHQGQVLKESLSKAW